MHIGTGWYCWAKNQESERTSPPIKFEFNTPKDRLIEYFKNAVEIYNSVQDKKDKSKIIKCLKKQIQYNRGDVIQKFLNYLINNKDRRLDSELSKFFRSKNWERFTDRQLAKNQC